MAEYVYWDQKPNKKKQNSTSCPLQQNAAKCKRNNIKTVKTVECYVELWLQNIFT